VDAQLAQGILLDDPNILHKIVERVLQELLKAQMTEHIGAAPYERSVTRKGRRNGCKPRTLRTRVGTLNLLVPRTGKEPYPPGSLPATSEKREGAPFGLDGGR
jgi:putative transposase